MKKYPYLSSPDFVVKKTEIYFKPGIVWNDLADVFNAKNMAPGYIYSDVTPSYIPQEHWNSVLAYFNSNVFAVIAKVVSQGMHYSTGSIFLKFRISKSPTPLIHIFLQSYKSVSI